MSTCSTCWSIALIIWLSSVSIRETQVLFVGTNWRVLYASFVIDKSHRTINQTRRLRWTLRQIMKQNSWARSRKETRCIWVNPSKFMSTRLWHDETIGGKNANGTGQWRGKKSSLSQIWLANAKRWMRFQSWWHGWHFRYRFMLIPSYEFHGKFNFKPEWCVWKRRGSVRDRMSNTFRVLGNLP